MNSRQVPTRQLWSPRSAGGQASYSTIPVHSLRDAARAGRCSTPLLLTSYEKEVEGTYKWLVIHSISERLAGKAAQTHAAGEEHLNLGLHNSRRNGRIENVHIVAQWVDKALCFYNGINLYSYYLQESCFEQRTGFYNPGKKKQVRSWERQNRRADICQWCACLFLCPSVLPQRLGN